MPVAIADLILPLAVLAVAAAALHDIATRLIPNHLVLVVLGAGIALRLDQGGLGPALIAAAILFLLCLAAWRAGALGGGDVKLITACAFVPPPDAVPVLVLAIALAGGVLSVGYLLARRLVPAPLPMRPAGIIARARRIEAWRIRRGGPLPYGVAILGGTLFTFLR